MKPARIPAELALLISRENKAAKWPSRPDSNRLEPVCSPLPRPTFKFKQRDTVFTIGSCFARNIEFSLRKRGFNVPCWDFVVPKEELWSGSTQVPGILNKYTPHSMMNEVSFAFGNSDGSEFLVERRGGWIDTQLHTNIPVDLDRAIERRKEVRRLYADSIRKAQVVIITLGLIEAWYDAAAGVYLNETPDPLLLREHPDRFQFEALSIEDTRDVVFRLIEELKVNGAVEQKVLLTVSPIPLHRTFTQDDVIVANMNSKSVLRVVAHEAANKFDWVDYFASYESVMLSDRTMAWQDDLIHASNEVVSANIDRMLASYM